MKFGGESVEGVARRAQHHAIDERAQDLGGLGADGGIAESCFQIRHLAPVQISEIGMELERWRLVNLRERRLDLGLAVLEHLHACLERGGVHPVLDRLHDAGDLALGTVELALQRIPAPSCRTYGGANFFMEGANELGHEVGRHELLLEPAENPSLDCPAGDRLRVATGPLGAPGGAAVAFLAHDGVGAATFSANQEPTQKEPTTVCRIEGIAAALRHLDAHHLLTLFHLSPEIVIDDPKLRYLGYLSCSAFVDAGDALAGARVLDVSDPVPLDAAHVDRVVEQAGAAADLAANGGITPRSSRRTRHSICIQVFCDGPRA